MSTLQEVLTAAELLPSTEKAQLIASLWNGVAPTDWVPPSEAWVAEASRRSEAIDAGDMTVDSWANVRKRARGQAGLDG